MLHRPDTGLLGFAMKRYAEMWEILLRYVNPDELCPEQLTYGRTKVSQVMWLRNAQRFNKEWNEFAEIVLGTSIYEAMRSKEIVEGFYVPIANIFDALNAYGASEPKELEQVCQQLFTSSALAECLEDLSNLSSVADYAPYYEDWSLYESYAYFLMSIDMLDVDPSVCNGDTSNIVKVWKERRGK